MNNLSLEDIKTIMIEFKNNDTLFPKPRSPKLMEIKKFRDITICKKKHEGLTYYLDSETKKYCKNLSFESLYGSYEHLKKEGSFKRAWYSKEENYETEYNSNPCNVSFIGSIFILLGIAYYDRGTGTYYLK